MSLSKTEQEHLRQLCPYLKEPIEDPTKRLFLLFAWISQRFPVLMMGSNRFRAACYEKPKIEKQLNEAESATHYKDRVQEIRNKTEVQKAENSPLKYFFHTRIMKRTISQRGLKTSTTKTDLYYRVKSTETHRIFVTVKNSSRIVTISEDI